MAFFSGTFATDSLSEDEMDSGNEAIFEKIFLPELLRLSDRYGGLGMHCYADARHQWLRNTRVVLDVPARDIDKAARLADQLQAMRQKLYPKFCR